MPRTELGPAACKRGVEWNPADAHSPVRRDERWDARFRNSLSKPPREGKGKVGPAPDDPQYQFKSNLEHGESVFNRKKPCFDRGRFKSGHRLDYTDYRLDDYDEKGRLTKKLKTRNTSTGASVPAVCEGARCGDFVKINGAIDESYSTLLAKSRAPLNLIAATIAGAPRYAGRMLAAAIMHHELFRPKKITLDDGRKVIRHTILVRHNGKLFKHTGPRPSHTFGDGLKKITRLPAWFGEKYPKRWNQAASSYLDIRGGKATNGFDASYAQAARRIGDEAFDNLSTTPVPGRCWCPSIFYEKPVLGFAVLWLAAGLGVHSPLSVVGFVVVFDRDKGETGVPLHSVQRLLESQAGWTQSWSAR